MITLSQILVATDFSEPAKVAVDYGRDLGRAYGATLHVIHVIEDLAFYGAEIGAPLADIQRHIEAAAERDLAIEIPPLENDPMKVVTSVRRGARAAQVITDYARANAIDLIIVGTHGRSAVSRLLMGSVAERVVRSAPCPVLTVRAHERDFVDVGSQADRPASGAVEPPAADRR